MKSFERIQLLANVLTAVCKRPSAEVGKLLKAVVAYVNEGMHTGFDSQYLEAYYDLLVLDIDTQRSAAVEKNGKCRESAKCRGKKNPAKPATASKKADEDSPKEVEGTTEETTDTCTANHAVANDRAIEANAGGNADGAKVVNEGERSDASSETSSGFNNREDTTQIEQLRQLYEKMDGGESLF